VITGDPQDGSFSSWVKNRAMVAVYLILECDGLFPIFSI